MKVPLLAVAASLSLLSAVPVATSTPADALTAGQATKNRLDPRRITSRHVQRHDYAGRHYR